MRLSKKLEREERLRAITDMRTFARGQEFLDKQAAQQHPKQGAEAIVVRKLTKAQTRMMKTKQKRAGLMD